MESQKQPAPEQPVTKSGSAKPSALEVRNDYSIRSVLFLALFVWFAYDGWINPEIHSRWFNRIGGIVFGICFVFCVAMAVSAHRALKRRQQSGDQP